MNTHADKKQENKSQLASAADSQMQSGGESTFQLVDNRSEAIAQRKLQEMANNNPQVSQLRAFQEMANNSPKVKEAVQLQAMADNHSVQKQQAIQKKDTVIQRHISWSVANNRFEIDGTRPGWMGTVAAMPTGLLQSKNPPVIASLPAWLVSKRDL